MITLNEILERGVYFFFASDIFFHASICLAEGFQQLGIPTFSNQQHNSWLFNIENKPFLFKPLDIKHIEDCAILVVDISDCEISKKATFFEIDPSSKCLQVVLNQADTEAWMPEFDKVDYILRSHMHQHFSYPENFFPLAFGISNRIQKMTENSHSFNERNPEALVNFTPSGNQSIRVLMEYVFIPALSKLFKINRTRDINHDKHHLDYFQRLKTAALSCAYCGNLAYTEVMATYARDHPHDVYIARWDSWRFWESLAAGCVTIHLDMEKYGLQLPVIPQNWEHYIGIDLDNPKATIERMQDQPELLAQIGANGKQWALENYSPLPIACRFLDLVTEQEPGTTQEFLKLMNYMDHSEPEFYNSF